MRGDVDSCDIEGNLSYFIYSPMHSELVKHQSTRAASLGPFASSSKEEARVTILSVVKQLRPIVLEGVQLAKLPACLRNVTS